MYYLSGDVNKRLIIVVFFISGTDETHNPDDDAEATVEDGLSDGKWPWLSEGDQPDYPYGDWFTACGTHYLTT